MCLIVLRMLHVVVCVLHIVNIILQRVPGVIETIYVLGALVSK